MVAIEGKVQAAGTLDAASAFEASASAAGYAMQFRYALLCAIQRLQSGDLNWQISIEAGDDVEVVSKPGYTSLYQLKLRAENTNLSDSARDLWKTIRIWVGIYKDDAFDFPATQLFLVTTSAAVQGGVSEYLGTGPSRNVESACSSLDAVADASISKDNAKAYAAWKSLSKEDKVALLDRVQIITESPGIQDVKKLLENSCHLSVRRAYVNAFVSRLEGWWFQRCIDILKSPGVQYITGEEFDAEYSDLRDAFLPENLPIDSDVPLMVASIQAFSEYLFMKQIELVGVGQSRILSAVRDYLRAYTQRSRWVRESLVGAGELEEYERRLVEEWRYVFDRLKDDLPPDVTEQAMSGMAKKVYQWVEEASAPPIRSACTERFLVRGSLHMLADRIESGVGWHPEFAARLIEILEPVSR
jgi:hypothetical protein